MMYRASLLLLGACGRLGFDALHGAAPDAAVDTVDAIVARHCHDPATPAPTITVSGTTFYYTSFTSTNPLAGVTVQIADGSATPPSATTDMQGHYSVSVATNGAPVPAQLVYAAPSYFTTTLWLDAPLTHDLTGTASPYVWGGDAPLWNSGAMGVVYQAAGVTEDPMAGSINVRPTDCAGNLIAGVSVQISPSPGQLFYIDATGQPSSTLTATVDPYPTAFAANAVAGTTHVTLSGGGLTWPALDIDVLAGSNNTLVVVRGD